MRDNKELTVGKEVSSLRGGTIRSFEINVNLPSVFGHCAMAGDGDGDKNYNIFGFVNYQMVDEI